jgi:hypothetical protein
MNSSERIKYFSIVNKINRGEFDKLTEDEMLLLQREPLFLTTMKKSREKKDLLRKSNQHHGTIEEILFELDLSKTLYK